MTWYILYEDKTFEYIMANSKDELFAQIIKQPILIKRVIDFYCIPTNITELETQINQIKAEIGEEEFRKRILSAFKNAKQYEPSSFCCYER